MKLKFCGIRRSEDIIYVNEFLPDYIGFVFAPSKRRVNPGLAATLSEGLNPTIKTVGVFVNEPLDMLLRIVRTAKLDVIQLHGDEDEAYIKSVRKKTGLPIWKAVRVKDSKGILNADIMPVDSLLLDSVKEDDYGGTGEIADWNIIRNTLTLKPFFLAGGLTVENLAKAVRRVQPYGIDISGGIETAGLKDRAKMKAVYEICRGKHS